jgi:hypothetical protein
LYIGICHLILNNVLLAFSRWPSFFACPFAAPFGRVENIMKRFLCAAMILAGGSAAVGANDTRPNVLILIADQWRAQAFGYASDPNVKTPHLDALEHESVDFTHAISMVNQPDAAKWQKKLDKKLQDKLRQTHDQFLPGDTYLKQWGYPTDANGGVPFAN